MNDITREKILEIINVNIESKKVEITEEMLDVDLNELGLDSLSFVKIIVDLEDNFEIEIPDEKLIISEMNTVNKIIEVVIETKNGQHTE